MLSIAAGQEHFVRPQRKGHIAPDKKKGIPNEHPSVSFRADRQLPYPQEQGEEQARAFATGSHFVRLFGSRLPSFRRNRREDAFAAFLRREQARRFAGAPVGFQVLSFLSGEVVDFPRRNQPMRFRSRWWAVEASFKRSPAIFLPHWLISAPPIQKGKAFQMNIQERMTVENDSINAFWQERIRTSMRFPGRTERKGRSRRTRRFISRRRTSGGFFPRSIRRRDTEDPLAV